MANVADEPDQPSVFLAIAFRQLGR